MARVIITNLSDDTFVLPHPLWGTLTPRGERVFDEISLRMLEESDSLRLALASNQFRMRVEESTSTRDDIEQASVAMSGGSGTPLPAWLETEITRTVSYTAVGGERVFKIPLGNYFKDATGETTLTINGNPLYLGPDYSHVHRNFNNGGPTSTADTCIGFMLSGGHATPGWQIIFTWKERHLLAEPPSVATVRAVLSGGLWVPDYSLKWATHAAATTYNAIQVALPPPGYVIEFWRLTPKRGGERIRPLTGENLKRDGQRYLPYVRGPAIGTANEGLFLQSMFDPRTAGSTWKKFRVCYYRPTTGARGPLAPETIVSAKPTPAPHPYDQHDLKGPTRYHLWVTR